MRLLRPLYALAALLALGACQDAPVDPGAPAGVPDPATARTGYVLGMDGRPMRVDYRVVGGWAIEGGDVSLGRASSIASTPAEAMGAAASPEGPRRTMYVNGFRWPGGVLRYKIRAGTDAKIVTGIRAARDHYNLHTAETGVRVEEVADTYTGDHLVVLSATHPGEGSICGFNVPCSEHIGYQAKGQRVWLNVNAVTNTSLPMVAVHELGHALGQYHEHNRCERNDFLVVTDSAAIGRARCDAINYPMTERYDIQSVMHYSVGEFNGRASVRTRDNNFDGQVNMVEGKDLPWSKGAHPGLTASDRRSLALLYNGGVNNAVFRGWQVAPPATLAPGQSFSVTIVFENNGTTTWSPAAGYKVGSQNPQDNATWGTGRVNLPGSIAPGQWAYVTMNLRAPSTAGTYNFQWRMLREGVAWFGQSSTNATITVGSGGSTGTAVSLVSLMHGKCLDAPSAVNGTRVQMWDCAPGNANQRWTYNGTTGEMRVHGSKCLDAWSARRLDPIVVHDCHGGANQKWDFLSDGRLRLRGIVDEYGRAMCVDIAYMDRNNGAQELLQYCHRGENQMYRRSYDGYGGATVSIFTDLAGNRCIDSPGNANGTQLYIYDCLGSTHAHQRFTRTAAREMRIFGKCVDGDNGSVGAPVKVWDCHGGANQKWDLTPGGELKGVNGLCIDVTGANGALGTRLILYTCTGSSPEQRWSYRDATA